MDTGEVVKTGAVVVGVVGAGYLIADYIMHKDDPTRTPIVTSAARTVVQTVAQADVPTVKVGMPLYSSIDRDYNIVDSPINTHNDMKGISALCNTILCDNRSPLGGDVAAAFASCECQTGLLANNCYNASLFNIHWTSRDQYPRVRIGTEIMPSFTTGAPSQVDAFRRSIQHFKAFLQRRGAHGEAALRAIMAGDPDGLQIAIGSMDYSPGYTRTVQGGRITGSRWLHARLQRLHMEGLL